MGKEVKDMIKQCSPYVKKLYLCSCLYVHMCMHTHTHTHWLFNSSSQCLTLYVVYIAVPRRLFYQQKIGQLLRFWPKSGLDCIKYSIFPTFSGEIFPPLPMEKGHCINVTTTTPQPVLCHPTSPLPPHIHTSLQQRPVNGMWAAAYFYFL